MEAHAQSAPASPRAGLRLPGVGAGLGRGTVVLYLSLIVLLPLAALASQAFEGGLDTFWTQVTSPQALRSLKLTFGCSLIVVAINAVFGTIIAWLLVRDNFPGKSAVNAVIDLPFALPTIVASLILIELYGVRSPIGINLSLSKPAVVVALLFVTLPFVVRAVQPLLIEMDREMEEAAASLGASGFTIFRRIIFPNLLPGLAAGIALAFARALGEYGSVLLFAGGLPDTPGLLRLHPPTNRVRQRNRRRRGLGRAAPRGPADAGSDHADPALEQQTRTQPGCRRRWPDRDANERAGLRRGGRR
jgi:sulfate transport system permease protein